MNATITLREYLNKNKTFSIPSYQRGYVWGNNNDEGKKNAVEFMMDSLLNSYRDSSDVFIQGITATEAEKEIILIDGQQRTTFLYLLLKYLGYNKKFQIIYQIRQESQNYLSSEDLLKDFIDNPEEEYQDIYFFKKTLRIVSDKVKNVEEMGEKEQFLEYLLDKLKFLYITIQEEKATKVFSMMNGNKAEMKPEELIKAELLRLASLNDSSFNHLKDSEKYAVEWDNNMLRSRYAREWDRWLQWWNRADVQALFKVDNVMGLLISTFHMMTIEKDGGVTEAKSSKVDKDFSFDAFRKKFLTNQYSREAKTTFDLLRRLQKRFEDAFNNPISYNKIGAIIRINDKNEFIKWYFLSEQRSDKELDNYYRLSFLEFTHHEITKSDKDKFQETYEKKYSKVYEILENNMLYWNYPEYAFRLLLRLNIDEDNLQNDGLGRKFDFSIWDRKDSRGRSLEHIYPKSKVWNISLLGDGTENIIDGNGAKLNRSREDLEKDEHYISRESCCNENIVASEHSIGNLVLLYKDDNSTFNDSSFNEKKELFFKSPGEKGDKKVKAIFKSRHLLHSIYKFANSEWTGKHIADNKEQTLKEFEEYYKQYREDHGEE